MTKKELIEIIKDCSDNAEIILHLEDNKGIGHFHDVLRAYDDAHGDICIVGKIKEERL